MLLTYVNATIISQISLTMATPPNHVLLVQHSTGGAHYKIYNKELLTIFEASEMVHYLEGSANVMLLLSTIRTFKYSQPLSSSQ